MDKTDLKLCAWCGPIFITLFLSSYILGAGFLTPPSPMAGAEEIASMYQSNAVSMQLSMIGILFAAGFLIPFSAAMYRQTRSLEQGRGHLLSTTFMFSAISICALFFVLSCVWATAAFRPENAPEIIQGINDFGWIIWVWLVGVLPPFYIPVGVLTLRDKRAKPLFPRWYGFFCLWVAVLTLPGASLILFKSGPFAWDGLISYWIPFTVFFSWYSVTCAVLLKSTNHESVTAETPAMSTAFSPA